jgi:N-acetylneuraminic acid mutarotase
MKKITLVLSMLLTMVFAYSQTPNTWTQKADLGRIGRNSAVGFSIGNKGYIGTGTDYSYISQKDFWEYDPVTNSWTQKADFGGGGRYGAAGFSIGSKGYIGTGHSRDFWEYDPHSNEWTQKIDFGGPDLFGAAGFSIGNKGYIGTGYSYGGNKYVKDFWEYDPSTDTWTKKADFRGVSRWKAVGFSIGNKGYIGTGSQENYIYYNDFWEYDPAANTWTQKADFGGGSRLGAVGFSISSKGYIGTGQKDSNPFLKDFWEYDPHTNKWTQKTDFGGEERSKAVGFSIGSKGYIGTGNGKYNVLTDFWEYTPEENTGCQAPSALIVPFISDTTAVLKWTLPATPVNGFDIVYHVIGSTPVRKRHATGSTTHIAIGNLQPGTIYRWKIRSDCTADTTKWINGPHFTTTSSALTSLNAAAVKSNNVSVQVIPNPNNGNFTIQMHLPAKAALTTLSVYNNSGVMIWQQDAGMLSGSVTRNIELKSKLPTGVYVLIIQSGNTQWTQKIIVDK